MYRRCFSTTSTCRFKDRKARKIHWEDELKLMNNVSRALTHFDDFYGGIYGHQWPSLRLALLSPPKYMAIPNTLTANIEAISSKLQAMGAFDVRKYWTEQQSILERQRKEINLQKDLGRLHKLDLTLEAIAANKKAEEMDVLYQNAPTSKREEMRLGKGPSPTGRVISDISQAAGDFVPSSELKGMDDFTLDSEYFSSYLKKHESPDGEEGPDGESGHQDIKFLKSTLNKAEFPQLLVPHTFENGSCLMFPAAARDVSSGLREYICVNGASLLPIMALDLRPGTNLLDMCAGPGTKSILSLMTLATNSITCNDLETSRLSRVKRIMEEFTGTKELPNVIYTKFNARDYPAREEFSRVLCDVPCLNDRVSCTLPENNIFKARRVKERLGLVRTQREILLSGFRALEKKDGSAVVYSTCTLSPIENDGVVMNALQETEVPNLHVDLIGLIQVIQPLERAGILKTMRGRCGIVVLPNVVSNFGPMYVSKIVMAGIGTQTENTSSTDFEDTFLSESSVANKF